ncbi:hypothetical protein BDV28DRAFT_120806 [Aspergillus coremiiformis]|uniref:Uncharacterized protein n=1 Tax=Aspergillus coremiiformis TaxID=138285 RepID=A0A5N6Z7R4_9EURO|nr:hypothetical protein BDV28DRAFT_120806 [Aspergillus coremiiformis]
MHGCIASEVRALLDIFYLLSFPSVCLVFGLRLFYLAIPFTCALLLCVAWLCTYSTSHNVSFSFVCSESCPSAFLFPFICCQGLGLWGYFTPYHYHHRTGWQHSRSQQGMITSLVTIGGGIHV